MDFSEQLFVNVTENVIMEHNNPVMTMTVAAIMTMTIQWLFVNNKVLVIISVTESLTSLKILSIITV